MEKSLTRPKLPKTDSIEELAKFWDTHDLTDFEAELEEAPGPVFVRAKGATLSIQLQPVEAEHLRRIAHSQGVSEAAVVRQWIVEKLRKPVSLGRPGTKGPRVAHEARRG